tara:strand:+ start:2865 stop:2993 length:129 start_codon:yes stop_codon:yes gene_type:complete
MKNKVPRYSIIITDFGKITRPSKKRYLIKEIKKINKVPTETT